MNKPNKTITIARAIIRIGDAARNANDYSLLGALHEMVEQLTQHGVNDTDADLTALLDFCKGLLCHINLIPINSIPESPYKPSASRTIDKWIAETGRHGIETTLRDSRGSDIAGACGQLKNTFTNGR